MKIHKEIYGTGEVIILLHGWAMHTGIWRDFAQLLAKNYQVICLDLPAHGRSAHIDKFELEDISIALLQEFPKTPCAVLGWSLGVTIALDLINRFPARVKGLVLMAGNPCFVNQPDWAGMQLSVLHKFAQNLILDCQNTLLRFLSLQVLGAQNYKTLVKGLKTAVQEVATPTTEILEQGLILLETADLRDALIHLKCPVIAILGARDTLIPVAIGEQMQVLQPKMAVHVLKKSGHIPFLSHQDEVLTVLTNFMESIHVS